MVPVVLPAFKPTVLPVAPPADKPADSLSDQLVLQQLVHDHDYWSVVAYSQEMCPVQDMLVGINMSTLHNILNVHCFNVTVCVIFIGFANYYL